MTVFISKKAGIKFNIRIYYGVLKDIAIKIIIGLSLLALVLSIVCIVLESGFTRYSIEVGSRISAEDIMGKGAKFGEDFDPTCIDRAGVYYFSVLTDRGMRKIRLAVKDTKAPKITVKDVKFAIGGELPRPEDFIDSVYEPDSFSGEYVYLPENTERLGEYYAKVRFTDASGNKTKVFDVKMTRILDNTPPKLSADSLIVTELGEPVSYLPSVEMSDDCAGEVVLDVDERELLLDTVGDYTVYLTAIDAIGNKSEKIPVTVRVVDGYSNEKLDALLDEIVGDLDIDGESKEDICREVYEYVRKSVEYTGDSPKGDPRHAAYRAIVGGGGDCYSYFALSKLLFDRLGIENMDIERSYGYTDDTHFWNLVNIGEGDEEIWYHFDATELRYDGYEHSGCLLTDIQINAYSKVRQDFYKYDKYLYPETAREIITRTPRLEGYY